MSIDIFFKKRYNKKNYNCAHFTSDVWKHLTGEDIKNKLGALLLPPEERHAKLDLRRCFKKLKKAESPSLALMQRRSCSPHVGIFMNCKVFHITERGVELQPLDVVSRCFDKTSFYK